MNGRGAAARLRLQRQRRLHSKLQQEKGGVGGGKATEFQAERDERPKKRRRREDVKEKKMKKRKKEKKKQKSALKSSEAAKDAR